MKIVYKIIHLIIISMMSALLYAEPAPASESSSELPLLHFNQWELLLYRPENSASMNSVRCWLKLEDENGNDVTYTKCKATYYYANRVVKDPKEASREFSSVFHRSAPREVYDYQKTYFLEGGLVMHLTLQPGKYRISVSTPSEKQFGVPSAKKEEWTSNVFEYDTENPAKVLWVVPTANENGFYDGGWFIDYHAPAWFKFTKPSRR